jgi:hypothetical protein
MRKSAAICGAARVDSKADSCYHWGLTKSGGLQAMSLHERIDALRQRHQELETQLEQAASHFVDDIEVHDLKKQKLAIKDEIADLEARL